MGVYLDNAATSHPKPERVYDAVVNSLRNVGSTPGRGSHRLSREAEQIVAVTRSSAALFFGIVDPRRLIFTSNATEGLNVVIKGWLRRGDRVLTSSMEHNAVARPLERLKQEGITVEVLQCDSDGHLDPENVRDALASPARLMVLSHASNVNGALQPVPEISSICDAAGVPLLLDAAQTAGIQEIDCTALRLGMMATSGHKGLLGPPGIGLLYVREGLDVRPLVEGGTGSRSEELVQPGYCPDRYESGTPNLPGIAGLGSGIDYILERGMTTIREHELALADILAEGLRGTPGVRVYCPRVRGTGTVSFNIAGMNPSDVASILDTTWDIAVRAGLHCAPMAHRTLGTYPEGTVRVSPGPFSELKNIELVLSAVRELIRHRG